MAPRTPDTAERGQRNSGISAQELVNYATSPEFLDTPYIDHTTIPSWGPGKGWDCSSFTSFVMKKFGVTLPAYSDSQYQMGTPVERDDLQPGDLVFFHTNPAKTTGHVGIYIGDNKFVNAANPTAGTRVQDMYWDSYVGARRVVQTDNQVSASPVASPATGDFAGDDANETRKRGIEPTLEEETATLDGLAVDKLNVKALRDSEEFGITAAYLNAHPEIRDLFKKYASGPITEQAKANFIRDFQNTSWFREYDEPARAFLLAQENNDQEFKADIEEAKSAVQAEATRIGAVLDDAVLAQFANAYLMGGWNLPARRNNLTLALSGELEDFDTDFLNYQKGGASTLVNQLKQAAFSQGVTYDDAYYEDAARSILQGKATSQDYLTEISGLAQSKFPAYAQRIAAGETARAIASPYAQVVAETLELDRNAIGLDNPWIQQALGGVDDKGNPAPMGLWDLRKTLMASPDFKNTQQYSEKYQSYAAAILQKMGFGA